MEPKGARECFGGQDWDVMASMRVPQYDIFFDTPFDDV